MRENALPLPALCGERVGVRGSIDRLGLAESPPSPAAQARGDLSPQAGRGEKAQRNGTGFARQIRTGGNIIRDSCSNGCRIDDG
jgi:hypothetical protein